MDMSKHSKKEPEASSDGNCYPSLVGRTLVALAGTCTITAVVLGVVYAAKSSPTDEIAALDWLAASMLAAAAAVVVWVIAICYAAIRHVVCKRRARRIAMR
jgi:hypothetical protein